MRKPTSMIAWQGLPRPAAAFNESARKSAPAVTMLAYLDRQLHAAPVQREYPADWPGSTIEN